MRNKFFNIIMMVMVAAIGLTSCEKTIEFKGNETDPLMVLTSQAKCDSIWNFRLSKSRFFLSSQDIEMINDATVTVEVNGGVIPGGIVNLGSGIYTTGLRIHEGDTLTIRASAGDLKPIVAGCRIPTKPDITNFEFLVDSVREQISDADTFYWVEGDSKVRFTFNDPSDQKNYYMLRLKNHRYLEYEGRYNDYYIYLTVNDNILFDQNASDNIFETEDPENEGRIILFSDERINGKTHTMEVEFYIGSFDKDEQYIFEISAISRDTYLYYKTTNSSRNELEGIFSEPVQIHCNVKDGIGILGAQACQPFRLKFSIEQ